MKRTLFTFLFICLVGFVFTIKSLYANNPQTDGVQNKGKILTMEEAVLGYNLVPTSRNLQWQRDANVYTYVENKQIIGENAADGKKNIILTLEELNNITGLQLNNIPNFRWSTNQVISFSLQGKYYEVNLNDKSVSKIITLPTKISDVTYNGKNAFAFTKGNNLYYVNEESIEKAITADTDKNIINGQTVSRNEFGISGGIFWSPDTKKIAFYQKDESKVSTFPLLDITTRTGSLKEIKYPMAGMDSEEIRLGIYDLETEKTIFVNVTDFDAERYLTNITWSPDSRYIYIQVLNRAQQHMKLNCYDSQTGEYVKTLLEEKNEKYIEPLNQIVFLSKEPSKFIYRTNNRDGYHSLYLCNTDGKILKRLTNVNADVAYVGEDGKFVYYTSAEVSPVENHLFKVDLKSGKKTRLTSGEGWHRIQLSGDKKYFIDTYSSLNVPRVIELTRNDGKKVKELLRAENPTKDYNFGEITLGTVKSADGRYDNYYRLIKPADFNPTQKYPVILYVYGGPHSQMVKNTWQAELRRWEMYMAQRGYVVFIMDNRGTGNQGADYEKAIYGQCGQAEMEDQMKGIEFLKTHNWVDTERIGVHGWSYGGFMTISLLTNYPETFKVGVAGGPVIDWKWYEIMYGERYMGSPHTNQEGYNKTSLIHKAKDLKGKLLICQGAVDPVVVWEHSLSFIQECINNNIQVDYFPYPIAEHNVMGRHRIHLMQKVTDYFEDYLK